MKSTEHPATSHPPVTQPGLAAKICTRYCSTGFVWILLVFWRGDGSVECIGETEKQKIKRIIIIIIIGWFYYQCHYYYCCYDFPLVLDSLGTSYLCRYCYLI